MKSTPDESNRLSNLLERLHIFLKISIFGTCVCVRVLDLLVVGMTEKDAERIRDIFRLPRVYILIAMPLNQAGSLISYLKAVI